MTVSDQTSSSLVLNPDCWHTREGRLPPQMQDQIRLVENFELDDEMLWVRDIGTSALQPFWLGSQLKEALHRAPLQHLAPSALPKQVLRLLSMCGVFVAKDGFGHACKWKETVRRCSAEFQQNGYGP
jgi:hypothetical protein